MLNKASMHVLTCRVNIKPLHRLATNLNGHGCVAALGKGVAIPCGPRLALTVEISREPVFN